MNIFNKMIPWFIPTKKDQREWYTQELFENPKEQQRLMREFSDVSSIYNAKLGEFESRLSKDFELYELYLETKQLAQQTNFIWNRIEYKQNRENELRKRMLDL